MKNFIIVICLIAQLTPYFVSAHIQEFENKNVHSGIHPDAVVTWTQPCEKKDGGPGYSTFRTLVFSGCSSNRNCTVPLNKEVSGTLGFILLQNEELLTLDVTAFALNPINNPTNILLSNTTAPASFRANITEYLYHYKFTFSDNPFLNQNGTYQIQLKMSSPSKMQICRTFTVYLNEKFVPSNTDATTHGASCSTVNEPCAFDNSMCLKSTCQCDQYSFLEGKSCKKRAGIVCENLGECITNAECKISGNNVYGYCKCKTGYEADPTDSSKCKTSGSSSILPIFFLVAAQILFVFWNKSG